MTGPYFNTTHLSGDELNIAIENAKTQEDKVLALFRGTPGNEYTPCEVHNLIRSQSPMTSTRRAITCLTKQLKLEKTGNQREGVYGKPNYTWRLWGSSNEV